MNNCVNHFLFFMFSAGGRGNNRGSHGSQGRGVIGPKTTPFGKFHSHIYEEKM